MNPREPFDGGSIEANALIESTLQLSRCDRDGLQRSQDVGEPQTHETDIPLFNGPQYELCLFLHGPIVALRMLRAG